MPDISYKTPGIIQPKLFITAICRERSTQPHYQCFSLHFLDAKKRDCLTGNPAFSPIHITRFLLSKTKTVVVFIRTHGISTHALNEILQLCDRQPLLWEKQPV